MLKGISPAISPELLACLCRMGHGDEIILADAHFPGHTMNTNVLRSDGTGIATLLDGILPLFDLDSYVDAPIAMMAAVEGDELDPTVEANYRAAMMPHLADSPTIERINRFAFYERTRSAFAVVMTGETCKYGNVLLKKGVTT